MCQYGTKGKMTSSSTVPVQSSLPPPQMSIYGGIRASKHCHSLKDVPCGLNPSQFEVFSLSLLVTALEVKLRAPTSRLLQYWPNFVCVCVCFFVGVSSVSELPSKARPDFVACFTFSLIRCFALFELGQSFLFDADALRRLAHLVAWKKRVIHIYIPINKRHLVYVQKWFLGCGMIHHEELRLSTLDFSFFPFACLVLQTLLCVLLLFV